MAALFTAEDLLRRCKPLLALVANVFERADLESLADDAVRASLSRYERRLETYFQQKVIKQLPDSTLVQGTDYDIEESALPFNTKDWRTGTPRAIMRRRPVVSIDRVRLVVQPDRSVAEIPTDWFRPAGPSKTGVIKFLPLATLNIAMTGWPVYIVEMYSTGFKHDIVPHFLAVDYTAGWIADDDTELPDELLEVRDYIAGDAHARFLTALWDAVPNGISIDGLSQQMDSVQQRLDRLEQRSEKFIADWRRTYGPPNVSII